MNNVKDKTIYHHLIKDKKCLKVHQNMINSLIKMCRVHFIVAVIQIKLKIMRKFMTCYLNV